MSRCTTVALLLVALFAVFQPWQARSAEVDLALVLAVDISNSMDTDEQELQRSGFVEAFRAPLVHQAIRNGMLGRIAVTYMEWAGSSNQQVVVEWTEIESPEDAMRFADVLARAPIRRGPRTSISGAIDYSLKLLSEYPDQAMRRVIDVSGDGANNQGRSVTQARDEALAMSVTINGLPLMLKPMRGAWDIESLDAYYRDCVIGGPGSFMIPVRERSQFPEAIKTKILREIAGTPPSPQLIPVQNERVSQCLGGG